MIAAEHEEVLGILDFVGKHKADGLDGLFSPVDVVAEEEIVGVSGEACVLEQFDQIGILSMDVA